MRIASMRNVRLLDASSCSNMGGIDIFAACAAVNAELANRRVSNARLH
jgi:hypothetical protein